MSNRAYYCNKKTGGAANALDGINGSTITNGDIAFVATTNQTQLMYKAVTPSTLTEIDPFIITPDNNPTTKRWYLQRNYGNLTLTKTSSYTATVADVASGVTLFSNAGSTKAVTITLPAGFTDAQADFLVKTTVGAFRAQCNGAQKIKYLNTLTSSGGYVEGTQAGTFWRLHWDGSQWAITGLGGTVTYNT